MSNVRSIAGKLTEYLATVGLEARLIDKEGLDETGFNEQVVNSEGVPIYGNTGASHRILRVRKEWPSKEVYDNVLRIQDGKDPVVAKPVKEEPKQDSKPEPKTEVKPKAATQGRGPGK